MPREVEAKFVISDDAIAKQLRTARMVDSLKLSRGVITRVRDTYLDTRDRRLHAAGFSCRRRRQKDGTLLITVKQIRNVQDAVHEREELEIALSEDAPASQWPRSPARECVLGIVGDAPLRQLFELRQTRLQRKVLRGRLTVAEWSVDHVCVRSGNRYLRFDELEIELVTGGRRPDLRAIAAQVRSNWDLAPQRSSKFERALEWTDQSRARKPAKSGGSRRRVPVLTLGDSMAEAARKTLLVHWEKMLGHERGAREGDDIEEVHDMRVATRRMRAALRIFADYLDSDTFRPFARMLRRAARLLGAVRDLDVFYLRVQRYLGKLPAERVSELDQVLAAWQIENQRARGNLIDWLDSDAFVQFKTEFDRLLRQPGPGAPGIEARHDEPAACRVRDILPTILMRGWASVRTYDELVSSADAPLSQYHELRIASKGLRYTLEFFSDAMGPSVTTLVNLMKRLQDHLGDLQDAVVASRALRHFLASGEWSNAEDTVPQGPGPGVVAPGVAAYLAVRQTEILDLVRTFPEVWSPICHADFKKRLLALIERVM